MDSHIASRLFEQFKEHTLNHRYITNKHIAPLFTKWEGKLLLQIIGWSVNNNPIYGVEIGRGPKRILMWSQMHGNESTTTKAVVDVLNTLTAGEETVCDILEACTLYILPILNPDGAEAYTRENANAIDLNRDAQALSQPESKVLRACFNSFKPHYCYNLHGQRTIFSAGNSKHPATVSFLAPAQDKVCSVTQNRKVAMEIISVMNTVLQQVIPNQVGVYDDAFNINCVGDTFQSYKVPTILFEAGHYHNDYARDQTRKFVYMALMASLDYIASEEIAGRNYKGYYSIPLNQTCFYDIIIRNAMVTVNGVECLKDIGILYTEKLQNGVVGFIPKIEKIDHLTGSFGHREIQADQNKVVDENGGELQIGYENVFVLINNKKTSLILK